MINRGMINRLVAALITIAFMTFVRPDEEPERVAVAFLSILIYEGIKWSIEYVQSVNRKITHKENVIRNLQAREEDGKRWAKEKLYWPIEEVNL